MPVSIQHQFLCAFIIVLVAWISFETADNDIQISDNNYNIVDCDYDIQISDAHNLPSQAIGNT